MIYKQFYQEFTETVNCLKVRYMGACITPAWKSSSWEYHLNILQLFLTRLNLKKGITRDWESKLVRINCISLNEFHEEKVSIRFWISNCNFKKARTKKYNLNGFSYKNDINSCMNLNGKIFYQSSSWYPSAVMEPYIFISLYSLIPPVL